MCGQSSLIPNIISTSVFFAGRVNSHTQCPDSQILDTSVLPHTALLLNILSNDCTLQLCMFASTTCPEHSAVL